jgi:hypothetical protein
MKVLATKVTDFLGSHIIAELLRKSIKVRVASCQGINFSANKVGIVNFFRSCTTAIDLLDVIKLIDQSQSILKFFRINSFGFKFILNKNHAKIF